MLTLRERMFTLGRKQEDIVKLAMFTFRGEGVYDVHAWQEVGR